MQSNLLLWLSHIGVDEQRGNIYLAALSLGSASAAELAHETGISRTAIYDNVRFLEKKGLLEVVSQGGRSIYVPLHPKELLKRVQNIETQYTDLLPDFLALYADQSSGSFVQMFEGKNAAKEIFEDILTVTKSEYRYLSPQIFTYATVDKKYMHDWVERRVKQGIHSKSLRVPNTEVSHEPIFTEEKKYLREIRFLPAYTELKASIYLYEHNIGVISTSEEGRAFIIHSPDLTYSMQHIFDLIWQVSVKRSQL